MGALDRLTRNIALAGVLLGLAASASQARRALIRSFFRDGSGARGPRLAGQDGERGLEPAERVRVVLLDGLGRGVAGRMTALSSLCANGIDLVVDNGFPTVSLPVQHVLWSGLTQQQSGIEFRLDRIARPSLRTLPAAVPESIAVAESHPHIVHSFAFSSILPPLPARGDEVSLSWRERGFRAAALAAVAGPARLVFIHVLGIDEAGHRHGAASAEYREQAERADRLLADLLVRAPPRGGTGSVRWLVLSDHGHRDRGGHGGAEEEIRLVRACIAGGLSVSEVPRPAHVHLVDLSRALADSLGERLPPGAAGRRLQVASAQADAGRTLPRPGVPRSAAALAVVGVSLLICLRMARAAWHLPWWMIACYLAFVLVHGRVSLSNPAVYPPRGQAMLMAFLPGLLILLVTLVRAGAGARVLMAQLVLPLGCAVASLILCGAAGLGLGLATGPPLVPVWSAHASLLLWLQATGSGAAALSVLAGAALARIDPSSRAGSGGRAPPAR